MGLPGMDGAIHGRPHGYWLLGVGLETVRTSVIIILKLGPLTDKIPHPLDHV
jgi:hypothetical protein